jgi:hypothetical protein
VRGSNLGLDTNGPWPGVVAVVPCTQPHLAKGSAKSFLMAAE